MAFLDETGLAELWKLVQAEDAERAQIATGSYTGTGTYGSNNKNSLTFDFEPKLVIVYQIENNGNTAAGLLPYGSVSSWYNCFIWTAGMPQTKNYQGNVMFEQSGNVLSWYSGGLISQLNNGLSKYVYFALG